MIRPLFVFVLLLIAGSAVAGGEADEADLQFQIAAEKYLQRDYRGALEHFLLSNRLVPNKNVVYNIARTYEQLQRFSDAYRYYTDALQSEPNEQRRKEIEASLARIAPKIAVVRVVTEPAGAAIYLDRRDLGSRGTTPRALGLKEGSYKVIVELEGYEPKSSEAVEAKLGTETTVELVLERILGTVRVVGEPGTEVFVAGATSPSCKVPCNFDLPPGVHDLQLRREGFEPSSKQVRVEAKQVTELSAALAPLTGSIVVSSDERDALVEIDGKPAGFTPAVVQNVRAGERRIRVSLRGYRPVERTVVVNPNAQAELIDLTLIPLREVTAASRFTETIDDAPSSVSIIDAHELSAFAYPTIAEAVRGVRGVHLSWDGTYSSISVRGLGLPNDYGNRLLVLSDGASLNDNILYSSYVGYDGRADLADVERIEVVRGPGSLLYGTGAMSGVINLVGNHHRDAPTSVHAQLGMAETSVAQGRAGFNLNLGEERGLWASLAGARSDGYPIAFADRTAHQVDSFGTKTFSGGGWFGPLAVQWLYSGRDAKIPFGPFEFKFDDPRSRFIDERTFVEARYESDVSEKAELLVRAHVDAYAYRGDYVYDDESMSLELYDGLWLGGEARLAFSLIDDTLKLSAGVEVLRHATAKLFGQVTGEEPPYLDEDHPFSQGALYSVADFAPNGWLKIQAGARADVYSTFGLTVNPRLALIFKLTESDVLKLLGGRAFRAPSVYEQFYNDDGVSQIAGNSEGATLQPETSYSGELEYTHRFTEDWSAIGAVHSTYLRDIIVTTGQGTEESPLQYVNSSEPVITAGAEIELRREWRQGWMIGAAYGYQLAKYVDLPEDARTESTRFLNAPEHHASLKGIAPIVPSVAILAVRVTLEAPRRISLESDETSPTAVITDVVVSGEVSRYGLSYAAGLYNAFDWQHALPVTEGWPASTMPQPGRTLRLTVKLTY
jgi:outer membrane receptor for ferrienterochelin and colicins